jgi:tRNA modification GTPase
MQVIAGLMTEKNIGAISAIALYGFDAVEFIKKIFIPASDSANFAPGSITIGDITDETKTIDQVVLARESDKLMVINTHANPIITADILKLFAQKGAIITTGADIQSKILRDKSLNTIAIEASLLQAEAKTIDAIKLLNSQQSQGLCKIAESWLNDIGTVGINKINEQAKQILLQSNDISYIINGVKIAIAGPANCGKSTLLTALTQAEPLRADFCGTTRDYVTGQCLLAPVFATFYDTAGLGTFQDEIDKTAQLKTLEIINQTDLTILLLDKNMPSTENEEKLFGLMKDKKYIAVINKSDMKEQAGFQPSGSSITNNIQISAKFGTGIEELKQTITRKLGLDNFDPLPPRCVTKRQLNLTRAIASTDSSQKAEALIRELLNGKLTL